MITEVWKPVIDYEGFYEVSNLGRVRSVNRQVVNCNGIKIFRKGRVLKPSISGTSNAPHVVLYKDGKPFSPNINQLVAKAFIPNPKNYKFAININGDLNDNSVNNLKWSQYKKVFGKIPVYITYNGKTQNYSQWGAELGISYNTVKTRLKLGRSVEQALTMNKYERVKKG